MLSDCLLMSKDERDREFVARMADEVPFSMTVVNNPTALQEALQTANNPVLFWNLDDIPLLKSMESLVRAKINPNQVWGLSDLPADEALLTLGAVHTTHYVTRRYTPAAATIVGKLLEAYDARDIFGLVRYGPVEATHQRITLPSAMARRLAAEAMTKVLGSRGLPTRLVSLAAQALDEFLMNAIFDAPVDANQQRFRRETPRSSDFPLEGKNEIYVDFLSWDAAIAISVTDRYGSLKLESLNTYLKKDYEKQDFKPRVGSESAGVGIYGMINAGLSPVFLTQPKLRTEAVLFIPVVKTYKEFRSAFQILSCFSLE